MKDIIVIKIGSSVFVTKNNQLDELRIDHIAKQIVALRKRGLGIVLVISGAVAYGSNFIKFSKSDKHLRQAAAGIGQIFTTTTFHGVFTRNKLQLAQLLLTKKFLKTVKEKKKTRDLVRFYIESGFITFINENDVLDLNSFGGNDHLAAEITTLINAKKLLILSTMEGHAHGTGGGKTKLEAVKTLSEQQIDACIVNGKTKDIILQSI